MKAFIYKDRTYIRVIPSKMMLRSTLIWEVSMRGDIFGMDIADQVMTIIPGGATVEHIELEAVQVKTIPTKSQLNLL